jgi:hypothetical protein
MMTPPPHVPTEAQDPRAGVELPQAGSAVVGPAETLARKINLLLDAIVSDSGEPFGYAEVCDGAQESGYYISRTRWSLLKAGKDHVVMHSPRYSVSTLSI